MGLPSGSPFALPVDFYLGADAGGAREPGVRGDEGGFERLGERDVGRIVGGDVVPQLPHTRGASRCEGSGSDAHGREVFEKLDASALGDAAAQGVMPQRVEHLDLEEVGHV